MLLPIGERTNRTSGHHFGYRISLVIGQLIIACKLDDGNSMEGTMAVSIHRYWIKRILVTHGWKGLETSRRSTWYWSSFVEAYSEYHKARLLYQEGKWKISCK